MRRIVWTRPDDRPTVPDSALFIRSFRIARTACRPSTAASWTSRKRRVPAWCRAPRRN